MNKRTKATSISKEVRDIVLERDKHCILCGTTYGITLAHFISRSSSGKGIEQNLACVCLECHRKLDQSTERKAMLEVFERYLKRQYENWNVNDLKYRKGE